LTAIQLDPKNEARGVPNRDNNSVKCDICSMAFLFQVSRWRK